MSNTKLYAQIEEKLEELYGLCLDNHVPMFVTVAKEEHTGTKYISRVASPTDAGTKLSDDKISPFNAALNHDFYLKIRRNQEDEIATADLFSTVLSDYEENNEE